MMEEEQLQQLLGKHSRSMSVESSLPDDNSESGSHQSHDYFPANKLFEYQWPLGDNGAEHYMLQEQVKEYLDIRGIQRKYPDLNRRNLDIDERKYLVGRGVVTETQSNMGLVAMKSDEVLELMADEYPKKYEEYMNVVQEREFQAALRRKMMEAKRVSLMADSLNQDITREAVQLTVEYNARLAEQRRTLRKEYHDTQTKISHVPRRPPVVCEPPKQSRYPVALLPGQYCDHYYKYTPQELKRLPLKTVMELPSLNSHSTAESTSSMNIPSKTQISLSTSSSNALLQLSQHSSVPTLSLILQPSTQHSNKSTPSNPPTTATIATQHSIQHTKIPTTTESNQPVTHVRILPTQSGTPHAISPVSISSIQPLKTVPASNRISTIDFESSSSLSSAPAFSPLTSAAMVGTNEGLRGTKASPVASKTVNSLPHRSSIDSMAHTMSQTRNILPKGLKTSTQCSVCFKGTNKKGEAEKLAYCSECGNGVHPSCYNLTHPATSVIKTYKWQCLECKTCQVCSDPGNEEKMVCCDECDRGYHSFCVGLDNIPSGDWLCDICGKCKSCGANSPGNEPDSKWKHEYVETRFVQTLCVECSSYFRRGFFCPLCLKVYHNDETDSPMVCCDNCDRWIHTGCDDISEERYKQLSNEKENSSYICQLCCNEAKETVDKFHKKYRE